MSILKREQLMLTNTTCESLLRADHPYRKIAAVLNIKPLLTDFTSLYSKPGTTGKLRDRPGTNNVAKIFNLVVSQMRASGVVSDVFPLHRFNSDHQQNGFMDRARQVYQRWFEEI